MHKKQECIPVGCVLSAAVATGGSARGCVCPGEGCQPGRVSARGVSAKGCLCQGVSTRGCLPGECLPGGGVVYPVHAGIHTTPLWTEWLTDRCKNITFPQLRLRTVKIATWSRSTSQIAGSYLQQMLLCDVMSFSHCDVILEWQCIWIDLHKRKK